MTTYLAKCFSAAELGWQKMDKGIHVIPPGYDCWEKPDGGVVYVKIGITPYRMKLVKQKNDPANS